MAIAIMLFNYFGEDEIVVPEPDLVSQFQPKTIKEKDTFSIQKVDRDPFLGTLTNKKNTNYKIVKNVKAIIKDPIPTITFGGVIKNQESSEQVYVVNINNKQYVLKKGQVVDKVKLLRGNAKEIAVKYNNKTITIPIQ